MDYLSLCLICKDENDYLEEWLDFHILVGVERFYIYDNESLIPLRETLHTYIKKGWVIVVEIPGKCVQLNAYDHCLRQYGAQTRWLGFIDTDEYIVPKTVTDLKELLIDYENYGGLAVSSLFFGSGGHHQRPPEGHLASYLMRTPSTFIENSLIKCIVQPDKVLIPTSPHNFIFKKGQYCVNEQFLQVDTQGFPNYTEKIQLNHYFCRSEMEIRKKLSRGRGDLAIPWPRNRFDSVNQLSICLDMSGYELVEKFIQNTNLDNSDLDQNIKKGDFLKKMADLARAHSVKPPEPCQNKCKIFSLEMTAHIEVVKEIQKAEENGNNQKVISLRLDLIQKYPEFAGLYTAIALIYLRENDEASAWQALSQAWRLAPRSYNTLSCMVYYFLRIKNYILAEKSCHLLLDIAPHDLTALGFLTEALIGLERFEEAIKIGVPVVELAGTLGELPKQMGGYLVKKMADYCLSKKDYSEASHLWECGVKCQPGNFIPIMEWGKVLALQGNRALARQVFNKALNLAPQNEEILNLIQQLDHPPVSIGRKLRHKSHL